MQIELGHLRIGGESPAFLIAEAGVNHDGDSNRALALVDAAADSGADAVKFQTFTAQRLCRPDAPKAPYQEAGGPSESQFSMLKRLELDRETHLALIRRCQERGLFFLSSPFDESSADLLDELGVLAFKIPSGELTNLDFLAHVARKGKPMLISTGMATLGEVATALKVIAEAGRPPVALFHCTSSYPARVEDANLRAMATLARTFGVPVGYSDHTPGLEVSLAAVALGASLIEKHLTLGRGLDGPDHAMSLEPAEWRSLVQSIRSVESALGSEEKLPTEAEREIAQVARKSLFAAVPLYAGRELAAGDTQALRPGTGLSPGLLPVLMGRRLRVDVSAGTALRLEHFE